MDRRLIPLKRAMIRFNPNIASVLIAKPIRGASWLAFATEERAGIVDTMSSTPTKWEPARACLWTVAVVN